MRAAALVPREHRIRQMSGELFGHVLVDTRRDECPRCLAPEIVEKPARALCGFGCSAPGLYTPLYRLEAIS